MRKILLRVVAVVAGLLLSSASPLVAQNNEDAMRDALEGRRVRLRIDMPGTQEGVDVAVDSRRPINYPEYGDRLKRYGIAIAKGDTATITRIKIKSDLIEFQLDGGGYGTLLDDTTTSANIPYVEKSRREKELEKLIKDETDSRRRARLKDELDDLRDERDRENRRIDVQRKRIEEEKRARLAERRLSGGSRFNLRFNGSVPRTFDADDVIDALSEYVTFVRR